MTWTFFWMMVVLKIPIVMAGYVVWWAIKQDPDRLEEVDDDGGIKLSPQPLPSGPRLPRRGGPHNYPPPPSPPRVRTQLVSSNIPGTSSVIPSEVEGSAGEA